MIATESTPVFSADNTSGWLRPIFERFLGHIRDDVWQIGHHVARKSGHFLGYGTLGLTFLRSWLYVFARRKDLSVRAWRWRGVGLGLASTAAVASLDEWHQTFLPSRTGLASDVMLDTFGAAMMFGLTAVVFRWWRGLGKRSSRLPVA